MGKAFSLLVIFTLCFLTGNTTFAQSASDFEKKFQEFSKSGIDSLEANQLLNTYFELLTPFNQVNQFAMNLKGENWTRFPLETFKSSSLYSGNISDLLNSPFPQNRLLGYLVVAAAGDKDKVSRLAGKLETEPNSNCGMWLGMSLMSLGFNETSKLFKWMAKTNVQAGGFLFPMFVSLPADSLQRTAYQFVHSKDWNERVYAIQLLTYAKYSIRTDTILREAIETWPMNMKGYAIVPARNLRIGKLLSSLEPLLDSTLTRRTALEALADSPTESDRSYVLKLVEKVAPDRDLMAVLQKSKHPDMVKQWLLQLQSGKLPERYYFSVYQDTLLKTQELQPFVQSSVQKISDPRILSSLIPALNGGTNETSEGLLIHFMRHPDSSVRYQAGQALAGVCTDRLKKVLTEIAGDTALCTAKTFDMMVDCGLGSFQEAAEYMYNAQVEHVTKMSALRYMSVFPKEKYVSLFRKVLSTYMKAGGSEARIAASGLAQLNDTLSIVNIISASELERKSSDWNSIIYIEALGKLKGTRSKAYVSSFLNSKESQVKLLAESIINNW